MWTIFGAGNLIWDIIDAIESNQEQVHSIVLNQTVDFQHPKAISLENYIDKGQGRIFGFINPNKQAFLEQIGKQNFGNVIHCRAWICNKAVMGVGNYFGANSTLASKTKIGDFNYINRNASIGHHTIIGSGNHIGPGAIVCGKCVLGNSNFIGAGAVIKEGITINDHVIVGAGALVTKDLLDKGVYIGSPVKKIDVIPEGVTASFYE